MGVLSFPLPRFYSIKLLLWIQTESLSLQTSPAPVCLQKMLTWFILSQAFWGLWQKAGRFYVSPIVTPLPERRAYFKYFLEQGTLKTPKACILGCFSFCSVTYVGTSELWPLWLHTMSWVSHSGHKMHTKCAQNAHLLHFVISRHWHHCKGNSPHNSSQVTNLAFISRSSVDTQ